MTAAGLHSFLTAHRSTLSRCSVCYICGLKLYLILSVVVIAFSDYKEKIEFTGQLLIEPKPKEPTKHQYDYGKCGKI